MTTTPAPRSEARPESRSAQPPGTLARRIVLTYVGMFTWPLLGVAAGIFLGWSIFVGANSLESLRPALALASVTALAGWGAGMWHCARLGLGTVTASAAGLWWVLALAVGAVVQLWWPIAVLAVVVPPMVAIVAHERWGEGEDFPLRPHES